MCTPRYVISYIFFTIALKLQLKSTSDLNTTFSTLLSRVTSRIIFFQMQLNSASMSQFEQNFLFIYDSTTVPLGKDSPREEDELGDCTPQTKRSAPILLKFTFSKDKLEENHHIQHFAS